MSRTKLLIGCTVSVLALIAIVAVAAVALVIWRVRSSPTTVARKSTAVGTPKGSPVAKTIGPEGGTISSADGRIILDVPAKAVAKVTNFSIQSLTNMAPGGLGDAYRLEPNGQTFSTPVKLTFKFSDQDINGSAPEVLLVSYQDNAGAWQSLKDPVIDNQNQTYTVTTQHFTDYALRHGIHIEPPHQTVRYGQSTNLKLVGCEDEEGWIHELLGDVSMVCRDLEASHLYWSTDNGSIVEAGTRTAKYTANGGLGTATVKLPFYLRGSRTSAQKGTFTATITITGAYKASGQNGPVSFSGTICSLSKPFKVTVGMPPLSFDINFVPSETALPVKNRNGQVLPPDPRYEPYSQGTFSYEMTSGLLHMSGNGTYDVVEGNTDHPKIICDESSKAKSLLRGIGSSGSGWATIQLNISDTNECGN